MPHGGARAARVTLSTTVAVYRLSASASFHGRVVAETFARSGDPLQLGHTAPFAVPVPDGLPFLARVLWNGPARCAVQDGAGAVHTLEPERPVAIELGAVRLELKLVPVVGLRWFEPPTVRASLAWFAIVLMATVATMQEEWLRANRCPLAVGLLPGVPDVGRPALWAAAPIVAFVVALGALVLTTDLRRVWGPLALAAAVLLVPVGYSATGVTWRSGEVLLAQWFSDCLPPDPSAAGGAASALSAEYLARLLRKDLDGAEDGEVIDDKPLDRPKLEPSENPEHVWMPAGNRGPFTRMGGAEEVSRRPVRTETEEPAIRPKRRLERAPPVAQDGVKPPEDDAEKPVDGVAEGLDVEPTDAKNAAESPSEEERGWGIPDWYDQRDAAMENLEIDLMLRAARRRLLIDPDDPAALSLLSYYQYLAQDYRSALRTYDRLLEIDPEDAASYNNKALVYKRLGDYKREEGLYRKALSYDPMDETAMNNLAVNLAHQGRYEEALAVMEQLEILDPEDPYADLHRSKIHAEMGNDEKALAYLEKALEGMERLDTLHHIEFRQDIRLDPSFGRLRETYRFRAVLSRYYGKNSPLQE